MKRRLEQIQNDKSSMYKKSLVIVDIMKANPFVQSSDNIFDDLTKYIYNVFLFSGNQLGIHNYDEGTNQWIHLHIGDDNSTIEKDFLPIIEYLRDMIFTICRDNLGGRWESYVGVEYLDIMINIKQI